MTDKRQEHIFLAIPDAAEESFLFLPTEDEKWRLPLFDVEYAFFRMNTTQRKIRESLQSDMTIQRWFGNHKEESDEITHHWVHALMENHQADWAIPEGACWFDATAIETLSLAEEWQREPILQTLRSLKDEVPELRPAWFRKGWMQKARSWVKDQLESRGYQLSSEIEQFKHWSLSALLRVETNQGNVFFKISNRFPLFAHEPRIMQHLSQLFPKFIPPVIAVHDEERWMLSADYGKMVWEANPDKSVLIRMLREYAQLQRETANAEMHERLEAAGCFNRRLSVLESQIEGLFADEPITAALSAEEIAAWKACQQVLVKLCHALSAYQLPDTLVHGDFHPGNVAIRENDFLAFDWTDACITHPFFDLPIFLDNSGEENTEELRKSYLLEWTAYEPMARLEEAYRLADVAAMLHQVVSYQGIHNGIEPEQRSMWAGAVAYYIRKIIKSLPELHLA